MHTFLTELTIDSPKELHSLLTTEQLKNKFNYRLRLYNNILTNVKINNQLYPYVIIIETINPQKSKDSQFHLQLTNDPEYIERIKLILTLNFKGGLAHDQKSHHHRHR